MSSSNLHGDGPLTPLEYQTIQTLLQSWSRKQGIADTLSVLDSDYPPERRGILTEMLVPAPSLLSIVT